MLYPSGRFLTDIPTSLAKNNIPFTSFVYYSTITLYSL